MKQTYSRTFSIENIGFSLLLFATLAYFFVWAGDYTNGSYPLILAIATLFGVFMAFNIGGNDVANSFGTSVGAGTLTIKQALLVAAVFEVSGAVIAGGEVTDTIRKGIVDLGGLQIAPMEFVYIMMSALFAAASWLLIATKKGLPVSTTHSIIGAIVGASITLGIILDGASSAFELVHWDKIGTIAISWVVSPVLGGFISFLIYGFIKKYILDYNDNADRKLIEISDQKRQIKTEMIEGYRDMNENERVMMLSQMTWDIQSLQDDDLKSNSYESEFYKKIHHLNEKKEAVRPNYAMQTYLPVVAAFASMVLTGMVIFKGLKHIDMNFTTVENYLIMAMIAALTWVSVFLVVRVWSGVNLERSTFVLFSWLQVFTASGFAFSHGSNDIANAIGPFAAILDILRTNVVGASAAVPKVAMLTFGIAMVVGLWFIGKHVIQTVGTNLTKIHPASGFSAELAAAGVVLMASTFGIPVSSTHILIGAVLGIGVVNANANWSLMKPIALAWVITLPASAIIAAMTFMVLSNVL